MSSTSERILDGMTLQEAIFRCGELQLSLEDTTLLILGNDGHDTKRLLEALQNPKNQEYQWYHNGVAEGNLKLNIDLEDNVGNPKAKDAYKNLSGERRRQEINRKLDELFGI